MIFVDSDFFIGFYHEKDFHHQACLEISERINEELATSWDVVDEVTTKLSYYASKEIAIKFLKRISENKIILIYPTPNLFSKAKEMFKKQTSKRVSFTDCMNMAIAQEKKIAYFLSFDQIYERNGFKLVK